jgi:MFS family permease
VGIVELLRTERSFRRLWLSQVVSELGDWFQLIAVFSMFPTAGGGSAVIASLFIARHIVAALATPIAGVVADRFSRGRVMIAADLARMVVVLGFLFVRGPEDIVLVFVLSLLLEGLAMFFEPARGAAIPQLLSAEKLYSANLLSGATWSAALALGGLAGGMTAALVGRKAAFVANAASFLLSAWFVLRARVPPLPRGTRAQGEPLPHPLRDLGDGLAYLRANAPQRSLLLLKAGALCSGAFFVLITVFSDRVFEGKQALTMGVLLGCRGVGALLMPFVAVRFSGRDVRGLGRALVVAFPVAAIGFLAFARAPSIAVAGAALFIAHGATSTIWVGSAQLLQVTVPNHVLGRVLAVELLLVTLAIAASGGAVGWLLDGVILAPRDVATALGAVLLVPFVLWTLAWRRHAFALTQTQSRSS